MWGKHHFWQEVWLLRRGKLLAKYVDSTLLTTLCKGLPQVNPRICGSDDELQWFALHFSVISVLGIAQTESYDL
jgi:hypothetical protein